MTDELIRKTFANCLILEKIGQGGMGIVYKAHHLKLNKVVCVKILSKDLESDPRNIDFFLREAEISKQLDHPNTVHVYDFGKEKDKYYIVMSYVDGKSLETLVKEKGFLSVEEASDIMLGIMKGLEHAHSKSIIHRDIKPSNIIINKEGIPRIIDFGLARRVIEEKQLTVAGEMIGTAYFMSPEQGLGNPVDGRADLYSAGATYFYILTGRYPFDGKTAIEVINHHIRTPLPNLYMLKPDLPIWTIRMIEKLMKKEPSERYQSATEVIKELEEYKKRGYKNVILSQDQEIVIEGLKEDQENKPKPTYSKSSITKTDKTLKDETERKEIKTIKKESFILDFIKYLVISIILISLTISSGFLLTITNYNNILPYILFLVIIAIASSLSPKFSINPFDNIILYSILFITTLSFSSIYTSNDFITYIKNISNTFSTNHISILLITSATVISTRHLYISTKNMIFKLLFLLIFIFGLSLTGLLIPKMLNITISTTNIYIIVISIILAIITSILKKNLFLLIYLLSLGTFLHQTKESYCKETTETLYQEELNKYKNELAEYNNELNKIKKEVEKEILVKVGSGQIDPFEADEKIKNEFNSRASKLKKPKEPLKEEISLKLKNDFNNLILSKSKSDIGRSLSIISIGVFILTNIIFIIRRKLGKASYEI